LQRCFLFIGEKTLHQKKKQVQQLKHEFQLSDSACLVDVAVLLSSLNKEFQGSG
jgi:hypothetical protein